MRAHVKTSHPKTVGTCLLALTLLSGCSILSTPQTAPASISSPAGFTTKNTAQGNEKFLSDSGNIAIGFGQETNNLSDVNPNYVPGTLNKKQKPLPTLSEMQEMKPDVSPASAKKDEKEDKLRAGAVRDAALSYGAKGGLAWASRQINLILEKQAGELSRIYDFNRFLIQEQGATLLPPVIVEAKDSYEQQDAGRTLRVADRYYHIIEQARFAPVAPLWHSYLIMSFSPPAKPEDSLLPKDTERELWRKFVAEGWDHGVQQAIDTYRLNLRRLNRDYLGMIRYSELLEKNMVTPPVVANQNLGVTGTGLDMRQNDQLYRIINDPRLNVAHPDIYHAPVSNETPVEAATPPGATPGIDDEKRIEN